MALTIRTILERSRLFRGLPPATLEKIDALAIRRTFSEGSIIFSKGDVGGSLYGVVTGRIRISVNVEDGREIFLNIMAPGDTFGEIALLDGQPRTATASATAPTELIVIMRDPFLALLQREPKLALHLLQLLCERIRWTSGLAEDSALLTAPARLARRLLSLARLHGRDTEVGSRLNISQEEMARFLGLSRQLVNQYLQIWKTKGWVELGRAKITVIDERGLESVVAGRES